MNMRDYTNNLLATVAGFMSEPDEDEPDMDDPDYDPTPYCNCCGAQKMRQCKCGPIAENE